MPGTASTLSRYRPPFSLQVNPGGLELLLVLENIWGLVSRYSPPGVKASIRGLGQIKSEVGRGRAWLRSGLNEGSLPAYLAEFSAPVLRLFYHRTAFLLDAEAVEIAANYLRALTKLPFHAPTNAAALNAWTPTPLRLAGLLARHQASLRGPGTGQPQMEAVEEEVGSAEAVATATDALSLLEPAAEPSAASLQASYPSDSEASTVSVQRPSVAPPYSRIFILEPPSCRGSAASEQRAASSRRMARRASSPTPPSWTTNSRFHCPSWYPNGEG